MQNDPLLAFVFFESMKKVWEMKRQDVEKAKKFKRKR